MIRNKSLKPQKNKKTNASLTLYEILKGVGTSILYDLPSWNWWFQRGLEENARPGNIPAYRPFSLPVPPTELLNDRSQPSTGRLDEKTWSRSP